MARKTTKPGGIFTTCVELAVDYQGPDGVQHKADDSVDLPTLTALELISLGRARRPDESTPVAVESTDMEA